MEVIWQGRAVHVRVQNVWRREEIIIVAKNRWLDVVSLLL